MSSQTPVFTPDNLNQNLVRMEYAVRGLLVQTACALEQQLQSGTLPDAPFDRIVYCNIGNPQALDDIAITFMRQVLSLVMYPDLLKEAQAGRIDLFPSDVIDRASELLQHLRGGMGAYTHSKGIAFVRRQVAEFIQRRDGGIPADPEHIFLTDGASPGISTVLRSLIRGPGDGIMLPVPQYPLYSASVAACGGSQVDYYLDEDSDWRLDVAELERAFDDAVAKGIEPRALAIINPGNPTGQVMAEDNMREVVQFCADRHLVLLADEVYQENVYDPDSHPFVSFKRVVATSPPSIADNLELFSFHSTSKGMLGECGLRGGYMEAYNIVEAGIAQLYKSVSVSLCSNTVGQVLVGLMVTPPTEGDPSYPLYHKEYSAQYESLKRRAQSLIRVLNKMEGVTCNDASGALYAFPQITLPPSVHKAAADAGLKPDTYYALELLNETGVCVVPGSGFGQADGTYHFRTTFLPPESQLTTVANAISDWHAAFMAKHA